jgi:hypothetical protein
MDIFEVRGPILATPVRWKMTPHFIQAAAGRPVRGPVRSSEIPSMHSDNNNNSHKNTFGS